MYVIVICATLPTLRQFVLFLMGRSYHNSAARSSNRYGYENSSGISGPSAGGSARRGGFPSGQLSSFKTRVLASHIPGDSIMMSHGGYVISQGAKKISCLQLVRRLWMIRATGRISGERLRCIFQGSRLCELAGVYKSLVECVFSI